MKEIVCVDLGYGNTGSIKKSIETLGYRVILSNSPEEISLAKKVILIGVGSYDAAMSRIRAIPDMESVLKSFPDKEGSYILGICLGMQILFESSIEGSTTGLGILKGKIEKFDYNTNYPVPQIGWNTLNAIQSHKMIENIHEKMEFFFANSYYRAVDSSYTAAYSIYNIEFSSVVSFGNVIGCQFHPEKSYEPGKIFLSNFLDL